MKNDVMILGQNAVYSCDTNSTGLNNNVLVVAGTGCGKTMSIMEARLLTTTESSLVVTCTKRQLVDKYTILSETGLRSWRNQFLQTAVEHTIV